MRTSALPVFTCLALTLTALAASAQGGPAPLDPPRKTIVGHLDRLAPELVQMNQDLWGYAELGLEERKSSARLADALQKAGFRVRRGVSGMPTAFVAEYGSGRPIIGLLAEYDALPELSQEVTGERKAAAGRTTGHGCGHCAFGTAVVGAALAVREAYERHGLKGTVRVYGTPAEETLIGKVYMALDGQFNDLDACLHWHPGTKNKVSFQSSKAAISTKFTFQGLPAHASGAPHQGRSALDGVELMNIGANYMREHLKESARIHYVVTNGGGQPNVVPATAQAWYYVRANAHPDVEFQFDWLRDIAEAAAKMSRTKVSVQVDTDCHEIIPNLPLSRLIQRNMERVGPPAFSESDRSLASQLQAGLRDQPGFDEKTPLHEAVEALPDKAEAATAGSTDVGDVSWMVPTGGFQTACFAAGSPGHSWQNVAAVGSPIGHKGLVVAAKVMALSVVDLLQDAAAIEAAKADFRERMKDLKYTTRIPKGQKAPEKIR
jgi:aminobenzoyl-glutamate utilization protein B